MQCCVIYKVLPCTLIPTDSHNIPVRVASQMLSQGIRLNIIKVNNLYKVRSQNVASKTTYTASAISHHHPMGTTHCPAPLKFLWRREKELEVCQFLIYCQCTLLRGLSFLRAGFRNHFLRLHTFIPQLEVLV